jgi:hypothetical protein
MKYTLQFLTFFIATSCMAQTSLINPQKKKQIEAELICNSTYNVSDTSVLQFTLNLTNLDDEYADSIALVFPSGITVVSSPNDPFTASSSPDGPETLNPITIDSIISWGNNDNNFGGISSNASYNFTVSAGVQDLPEFADSFNIYCYVSGDGFGSNPGDSTLMCTVYTNLFYYTPITALHFTNFYYEIPLSQSNNCKIDFHFESSGTVDLKFGIEYLPNSPILFHTDTFYNITGSMDSSFNNVSFNTLGYHRIALFDYGYNIMTDPTDPTNYVSIPTPTGEMPTVAVPALNNDMTVELTTNRYANYGYTPAIAIGGAAGTSVVVGNIYEVFNTAILDSVYFFCDVANIGTEVTVKIFDVVGNSPSNTLVGESLPFIQTTSGMQLITLPTKDLLGNGLILSPGKYLIGIQESTTSDNMSLITNSDGFFNSAYARINGGAFTSLNNFPGFEGLTPHVGAYLNELTVGLNEKETSKVKIYPNPTNGNINIDLSNNIVEKIEYNIVNIHGQVVKQGKVLNTRFEVDLSNEAKGVYFLELKSNSRNDTHRIIKY